MIQEYDNKDIRDVIDKSYEAGIKEGYRKCKEEMLKDATEAIVHQIEVEGIKLNGVEICSDGITLDESKFRNGDKVKIIVIKEN